LLVYHSQKLGRSFIERLCIGKLDFRQRSAALIALCNFLGEGLWFTPCIFSRTASWHLDSPPFALSPCGFLKSRRLLIFMLLLFPIFPDSLTFFATLFVPLSRFYPKITEISDFCEWK
jgi:hypothetical protein